MFDYTILVLPVRRLVNDSEKDAIDIKESTESASYYILVNQDAYITIKPSGLIINGIPIHSSGYVVNKNLIKMNTVVPISSEVIVDYSYVSYRDSDIIAYLGDSIHTLVEPIFHTDFEFGIAPATSETETAQDIDRDLQSLFIYGAAMGIVGDKIGQASDDAIYIKDGDTVIDTATSSKEKFTSYTSLQNKWKELLNTVRVNNFQGITMV